ncbi:MAG: pyrroloquinoline quinone biosynthesis protein PqqB [Verrucomicrobia bacterium]|nr:MAG: pyrroloquinoline quinone biosynthesis protein PqqB [Verrucomicrobiota bacterium]
MIRIHILGTAAGGGLPQWNCTCANCVAARIGKIAPQTQSSIAISGDSGGRWFLINASPDLPRQIESMPRLQPHRDSLRNTPIAGVLLTNADIDHALGLLHLRQQEIPLVVYATDETRTALAWIDRVLSRFCGIEWRKINADFQPLSSSLAFRAIELPKSVAFQCRDNPSGATALFALSVGELADELRNAVHTSELILFDGTFWSDGELGTVRLGARAAREMNHLPISDGSLDLLRQSPARRKIYSHINNTNPILMPGTRERARVEQAGIEIASDGLEIVI